VAQDRKGTQARKARKDPVARQVPRGHVVAAALPVFQETTAFPVIPGDPDREAKKATVAVWDPPVRSVRWARADTRVIAEHVVWPGRRAAPDYLVLPA